MLFQAAESLAAAGESAPGAAARAHAILRRLDAWAERGKSRHISEQEESIWTALQGVAWCPVLTSPPEPGLPWPHAQPSRGAVHQDPEDEPDADPVPSAVGSCERHGPSPAGAAALALAPPRMVRPASDAWIASAPLRLCSGAAGASLRRLLGWSEPLAAPQALAQLVALSSEYPDTKTGEWPADAPAAAGKVAAAASSLYSLLAAGLGDPLQRENLEMSMTSAPVVWVSTGFTDGVVCALSQDEPGVPGLLFTVPPEIGQVHAAVLRMAGVQDRWVVFRE